LKDLGNTLDSRASGDSAVESRERKKAYKGCFAETQ